MADLTILTVDDINKWCEDNNVDLTCPTCKGTGLKKPDDAKVEEFIPTDQECIDLHLQSGEDYYRVLGIPDLDGNVFDTREEAENEMNDPNNWPDGDSSDETCDDCHGRGSTEPMMNYVHLTDMPARMLETPAECGPILAVAYEDKIALLMTGGGMDLTPHFVEAWMTFFPDATWIPDNYIDISNLSYLKSYLDDATMVKALALMEQTIASKLGRLKDDHKRMKEYMQRFNAEKKGKRKGAEQTS